MYASIQQVRPCLTPPSAHLKRPPYVCIEGVRTEFFEDSGHMLFWEEPEKFNRLVAQFVAEH